MDLLVLSHLEFYVVNGAIYLIASYDFIVNRTSSYYAINQQQLQWVAYVVPRVASTYSTTDRITLQSPEYIGAHRIKHAHNFYFILFMSRRLGIAFVTD